MRNGKGRLEWEFAVKRAVGRDKIGTGLFVISYSSEPTNSSTIF